MLYAANGQSIPIELFSTDSNFNKLEAVIFYDWVSPV